MCVIRVQCRERGFVKDVGHKRFRYCFVYASTYYRCTVLVCVVSVGCEH